MLLNPVQCLNMSTCSREFEFQRTQILWNSDTAQQETEKCHNELRVFQTSRAKQCLIHFINRTLMDIYFDKQKALFHILICTYSAGQKYYTLLYFCVNFSF
ncbi:hypothetical protein LDENG_00197180 [Lucifuga dentata]|nr:hypothetical protein LDENG_00197180 [Lucifuga dentata]